MSKGFNFADVFPERWLHAEDLSGKQVTLTIKDAYVEELRSPTGEKSQVPILSFEKTRKEYVLNITNARVCKALWGDDAGKWIGHRVVIEPQPEQMSPSGYKIVFCGSPDIDKDVTVVIQPGKKRVIKATGAKGTAPATEAALSGDSAPSGSTDAEGTSDAADGPVPGADAASFKAGLFDAGATKSKRNPHEWAGA
jgi:hypothetical protein